MHLCFFTFSEDSGRAGIAEQPVKALPAAQPSHISV